jgi:hypothetical protein
MPLLTTGAGAYRPISSDAAQTTAFLARTSGLSGTETAAYKALINGLVSDGTWSLLDALYIFATNNTTTAKLNLVSTSFTATYNGTPAESTQFTADQGYTGDGSTVYLDTGFIPSSAGGVFTLNSSHIGQYMLTSRTVDQNYVAMGSDTTNYTYVQLKTSGQVFYDINAQNFPSATNSNAQGFYIETRTGASATAIYKNGNATALGTGAGTSASLTTGHIIILALDNSGSQLFFDPSQIAAATIGAGISSANYVLISNRINAYMTALGINVY